MWKVKAHGCGNTAPATQHRARKLSGTERTLEQNRAAPAQKFDSKRVAQSSGKSLLFACQHAFFCLLYMDELCSSSAGFRPRPGHHKTAPQPPLFLHPSCGLSGGPLTAGADAALWQIRVFLRWAGEAEPQLVPLASFLSETFHSPACGTATKATARTRLLRVLGI